RVPRVSLTPWSTPGSGEACTASADHVGKVPSARPSGAKLRWKVVIPPLALIAMVAVVLFLRLRPARALTEKDSILLSDFVNTTGDPVFDGTLKQALAVQLEQSPFLKVFPQERVQETLRYMGRSSEERITPELAR